MQQQQGFARDFDGLHHHVLGFVCDVAHATEPVTGGNHLGAECGEPPMADGACLIVADVVGRVMHKLQMPDAALMRFLQPFELAVEEVETFHVSDDRGLPRLVRGLEIGCAKRATHAMAGDQLVHPGKALEVVPVELARLRRAHHGQGAFGIPAEDGAVRHVRKARDRQRSRAHRVREIVARRCFRGNAGFPAMRMDIDGNGFAQDIERGGGGLGRPARFRRAARSHLPGQQRPDRRKAHPPDRGLIRRSVGVTAAVHLHTPEMMLGFA